jgi:alanyl-tRNA synthetase
LIDHTQFHWESVGQIGDLGNAFNDGIQIQLLGSIKPLPGLILHNGKVADGKVVMAAGGIHTDKLDEALKRAEEIIKAIPE